MPQKAPLDRLELAPAARRCQAPQLMEAAGDEEPVQPKMSEGGDAAFTQKKGEAHAFVRVEVAGKARVCWLVYFCACMVEAALWPRGGSQSRSFQERCIGPKKLHATSSCSRDCLAPRGPHILMHRVCRAAPGGCISVAVLLPCGCLPRGLRWRCSRTPGRRLGSLRLIS